MIDSWWRALEATRIATLIREDATLFPWIECVHVLALSLVLGFIAIVDLRLLGWTSRSRAVQEVSSTALPITWTAFAVAVASGGLLFASNATKYVDNVFFQTKMLLLVAAGANMALFHLTSWRKVTEWQTAERTALGAKIAGAVSLCLWLAIATCGRWIGFA
jgi:hypothetical protein